MTAATITEKLTLGQPVEFTATLYRATVHEPWPSRDEKREWREKACEPRHGIVVGTRTLRNGLVMTEEVEEGSYYTSFCFGGDAVPAFLIAFSLNRKPILVPQSSCVAR